MSDDNADSEDGLEYSREKDSYRVEFSQSEEQPSKAVVKAVAAIAGCQQDDLDPLFYVLDPECLDSLFQRTVNGGHRCDVEISFTYHGYDIAVHSYGIIEIQPVQGDTGDEDDSS